MKKWITVLLAAGVLPSGFGAETSGLTEEFRNPPDALKNNTRYPAEWEKR